MSWPRKDKGKGHVRRVNDILRQTMLGEIFKPIKKQMTVRLDADVLLWLKLAEIGKGRAKRA